MWCRNRTCRLFPWLSKNTADADGVAAKMTALRKVGVPYSDPEIPEGKAMVEGSRKWKL